MFDVLVAVRDATTRDLVRTAFDERGVFRATAAARERLSSLLKPPSAVAACVLDLDASSLADRDFLASLRALNEKVVFVAVGTPETRGVFGPSKLQLDVRTFIRAPIDPFDLARRLKRLADALVAV
jgi:hypothetical protein